jgi:hypothetical protein
LSSDALEWWLVVGCNVSLLNLTCFCHPCGAFCHQTIAKSKKLKEVQSLIDVHAAETAGLEAKHIMQVADLQERLRLASGTGGGEDVTSGAKIPRCQECAAYETEKAQMLLSIETIKASQLAAATKGNAQENELGDMQAEVRRSVVARSFCSRYDWKSTRTDNTAQMHLQPIISGGCHSH